MKAASIQELKQELQTLSHAKLQEICLRLARFKKDNKELLAFLLFESHDEEAYINNVKAQVDEEFETLPGTAYLLKKRLRKILSATNKYIRFSGSKQVEVVLLMYFCTKMNESDFPFQKSTVLLNIYEAQLKKIRSALEKLHEDLQYDYGRALPALEAAGKKKAFWRF